MISIVNQGQAIKETNYWSSEYANKGLTFLSWNAGAARLLLPDSLNSVIQEVQSAQYVVISKGKLYGKDALELMFEDHSDSPYCFHIMAEMTDRLIPEAEQGSGFYVALWTQKGQEMKLPGKYRTVETLPSLEQWIEQ